MRRPGVTPDPDADRDLAGAILRAASDYSVIGTDLAGTITLFNTGAERILGYRAEEVVGRHTPALIHDPDEVALRAAELGIEPGFEVFVAAARRGDAETREWTYVRKDGSRLPVSLAVTGVLDNAAALVGFVGIARDLTTERSAREELIRSAERFGLVFEASPVPTAITRIADGMILMANPACLALLGWTREEFVGRTIAEVGFWARPERQSPITERLSAEGRVRDMEEDVRTKDGRIRHVMASVERLDFDGEPSLVGLFYDITDRTRLEEALRESEQRLRDFLDNAPALVSMKDTAGRYVLVNQRFVTELGLSSEDALGKTAEEVYPADVARALTNADREVIADGTQVQLEQTVSTGDGRRTYLFLKFPLRTPDGGIAGTGTIATDVTESRRAEEALRESEERFRQLAESIDVGFMLRTIDPFEILYASPMVEPLMGVSLDAVRLDPAAVLAAIHPEDRLAIARRLGDPAASYEGFDIEYRAVRPDGSVRWIRSHARPVRPRGGKPTRVAVTLQDITVLKLAEIEVQAARTEAERANRAKSEFLSRMSHELRTPLNAILGFGQLLEMDELDADQRDSVDHIRTAGRHLLELINEVLDISRIETGDLALSLEPVRLADVTREVLGMIAPIAASRTVEVHSASGPADAHVMADRQRLKQVLLNLASNAVKYNREGGEVRLSWQSVGPSRVRLEITDTGIGIAESGLDRLFTPFERLGADQSAVEGTGLGLALTKRLVETMGGAVGAMSEVGRGSTFWVELASAEPPDATAGDRADPRGRRPTAEAEAGPDGLMTILYVEDNLSNIELLERLVASRPGVSLLTAMQGRLGLELAVRHRPDLVLLDLNLPDVSGEEVLRRLRAEPATAATPIVVLSADATPGQVNRLLAHGADDYLTKPFEVPRVLGWIDRAARPRP